ncbi:MAG: 4Fe-4S binding protein [Oscillospiraceae bacterium]|nr:4Fe-4S binding protein [Oscillospiraceae bacterium]
MGKYTKVRTAVQVCWTALSNGYLAGFLKGKIYTGPAKNICVPGLNCYSCPGALGACPIGALQATLASRNHKTAFYAVGFLILFGAILGRIVCGFLCPFGLVQDLIYKIPIKRKRKLLPGDRWLKYLKYVILVLFCIVLPLVAVDAVGQGTPWFCAYICPSGTFLGGIPLVASTPMLQAALGWLWRWKLAVLLVLLVLSLFFYRPFCRYVCPLGAIYGCFNQVSLLKYKVEESACVSCGKCQKVCPFDIDPSKTPNAAECIRCGRCLDTCPTDALEMMGLYKKKKD